MKKIPAGAFLVPLLLPLLAALHEVQAAGGAHIVDDSEVVEPGTCQLETWITAFDPGGGGFANAVPACTLAALPRLEIGLQFQHFWFNGTTDTDQLLGPALKLNFVPEEAGVGVGLAFNGGVNLRTGDLETATLIVPVTIPLDDRVRFNFNAGWSYIRIAEFQNAFFWGAQAEAKIGWQDVSVMVETFGRAPGAMGAQMGLRWRPNDAAIEFDLLAGSFFDEVNAKFFTVGVTFRY